MRFEIYLDPISRAIQMITQPHTLSPIHIPTCCIQPSNLEMRQGLRKLQQQCQKPSTKAHPSNHPVLSLKFPSVHHPPQTLECLMRVGDFFEKRLELQKANSTPVQVDFRWSHGFSTLFNRLVVTFILCKQN